jgi:hypothetical protein
VLYIEQRYILRRLLRLLDSLFATPVNEFQSGGEAQTYGRAQESAFADCSSGTTDLTKMT